MEGFTERLLRRLLEGNHFVLTTHRNADPDGLGSEIGLDYLLRSLGKVSVIVNQEPLPERYTFMDPEYRILSYDEINPDDLREHTIVFLDNSEMERAGLVTNLIRPDRSNLIVIDHHDSTHMDHKTYFQNPEIGSTSEIVYELLEGSSISLPQNIASAIYTGIVEDTGHFKYGKTRARTHEIASHLLDFGINPQQIADRLQGKKPVEHLFLRRLLYNNMFFNEQKNIAWFQVRRREVEELGLTFDDLDGMVNELLEPEQIRVSILFTEREEHLTRVSIRSRKGVDMIPAVVQFGGGGHKNACGATIQLDLEHAVREFIPVVTALIT